MDFVRDLKDRYFLICLEMERAFSSALKMTNLVDEEDNVLREDDWQVRTELVSLFPFHWCDGYFEQGP